LEAAGSSNFAITARLIDGSVKPNHLAVKVLEGLVATILNSKMVARDGIEPPTPAFSGPGSA